jgi:hypothetical protein
MATPYFSAVPLAAFRVSTLTAEISLDSQNRTERKYRNWIGETSELKSAETIN